MKKSDSFFLKEKRRGRKKLILAAATAAAFFAVMMLVLIPHPRHRNDLQQNTQIRLSNETEVVQTIRDGLTDRKDTVRITFSAKGQYHDRMTSLADSLFQKALEPTDDPKQGDYLRFQYGGYHVRYSNPQNKSGGYDYSIRIMPVYYTNLAEEGEVDQVVQTFSNQITSADGFTEGEKIRAAHDFLTKRCEYDWRNRQLTHRHTKSTAYGALVKGEASCQGYSVAMYRLLMEIGIRCRIVTGNATSPKTGNTEYHAWNLVLCDGAWYNLDASWDDETESDEYFLKSDQSFSSHVRDKQYDTKEFRKAYPVSESDWNG